jgi:glutathione synthase/RimK-type ligase-like ATP-grasp enzyme/ribosomal protein S18 acetylase RimI-like enzyme
MKMKYLLNGKSSITISLDVKSLFGLEVKFMNFREGRITDLDFLVELESSSFEESRRASRKSIKNSLVSQKQKIIIVSMQDLPVASVTLILYKTKIRVYSVAVKPGWDNSGIGTKLMFHVLDYAGSNGYSKVSLEADTNNERLVSWYKKIGFKTKKTLKDYYGYGKNAFLMEIPVSEKSANKAYVVTDYDTGFFKGIKGVIHIRALEYLENEAYHNIRNVKVFNFCTSYAYQTIGYYVSLLALARNHTAYPSSATIRDSMSRAVIKSLGEEIFDQIQDSFSDEKEEVVIIESFFGISSNSRYKELISSLDRLFETPIIKYQFKKNIDWELRSAVPMSLHEVKHMDGMYENARNYFNEKGIRRGRLRNYEYDIAILVNRDEAVPPSNDLALKKFKKAAEEIGFYVEFITKKDYKRLLEFDALFIRTTTYFNEYTYEFSRYAYSEGLVVIDDPWSILGCSNKLFLYERLKINDVKMPNTWIINKKSKYKKLLDEYHYPIVLKQPDSAFSLGVYKVNSKEECSNKLHELFKRSELIIAQEFMPSDYDWRIGILNGEPIYACRYYMAKNHWQVVNWNAEDNALHEGYSDTLEIMDVPKFIINTAVRAATLVGDGLYGVDMKEVGGEAFVIEVNDNPNIDSGIEDLVAGDKLYMDIMKLFYERIENSRNTMRYAT